ncbi:hypothetical protein SASPL_152721 [Salvia splendens]|uniref:Uncharacterized protein n=1 Tax=Salvia splendens TaxID=180675 RepID=A0A8X8W457_SALSN|nr:hypothetical protein SASPL_152721 [Salvia splendens]
MTTCWKMLIRPCVLRHTILSTKRGISTSHPIIISKGRLSRSRVAKFLTLRSSMSSSSTQDKLSKLIDY